MYSLENILDQIENDINYLKSILNIVEKEVQFYTKENRISDNIDIIYSKDNKIQYIEIYYIDKQIEDSYIIYNYSENNNITHSVEADNLIIKLIEEEKKNLKNAIKGYQKSITKIKEKLNKEKLDK